MPFPNPANYFLPTPEAIEIEVTTLGFDFLKLLNLELSKALAHETIPHFKSFLSDEFDNWVANLKTDELIDLTRWIGERLKETVVIPQEEVVAELLGNLHKQSTNHDRETI